MLIKQQEDATARDNHDAEAVATPQDVPPLYGLHVLKASDERERGVPATVVTHENDSLRQVENSGTPGHASGSSVP